MPGPGTARDRPVRGGTVRDAATAGAPAVGPAVGPAAARLRAGLDGWRRHISRRQRAAAARRWSLITLGAALAGVAVGRLDGTMLVTAVAAAALPVAAGAVSVVRRRVSAEDAARHMDAAFGFDEQVATALCCTEAGAASRATDHNRLVAELIERAAGLVTEAGGMPGPRTVPAYGEWAAMAVTAAAVAAVAAVPGSHPSALAGAAGGPGRASTLAGATAASRPGHAGGVIPGNSGTPDATVTSGHETAPRGVSAKGTAAGGTRSAASATDAPIAPPTGGAPNSAAEGGAPTSPERAGTPSSAGRAGAQNSPGNAGTPSSAGTAGTQNSPGTGGAAATGASGSPGSASGSGQHGTARPAAGQSPATHSATQAPTTRDALTQHGGTRATPARNATGQRGAAARGGGLPAGDAAGTAPGSDRASAHPAQLPPLAGNTVLLIVLPGGDGVVAAPTGQGKPGQQPEGNGGTFTGIRAATAPGSSAEYVPPDQNEVPFPYQALLGRYF